MQRDYHVGISQPLSKVSALTSDFLALAVDLFDDSFVCSLASVRA